MTSADHCSVTPSVGRDSAGLQDGRHLSLWSHCTRHREELEAARGHKLYLKILKLIKNHKNTCKPSVQLGQSPSKSKSPLARQGRWKVVLDRSDSQYPEPGQAL